MGSKYTANNIVMLTIEEHAEAHRILYEQYGKWQDKLAWLSLSGQISKAEIMNEGRRLRMLGNKHFEGRKHSQETIEKMSQSKKGAIFTDDHKAKLSAKRQLRITTDETRNKLKQAMLGKQQTLGHTHSEETKAKMRAAQQARRQREANGNG